MHTPGHSPACTTHVIGDAAFVGDTLFMPDGGLRTPIRDRAISAATASASFASTLLLREQCFACADTITG
jgi:glyoxylase-like metal-dependent hydrolase (beta-lactamase superfamily II)